VANDAQQRCAKHRAVWHKIDALRMGMNWNEEDAHEPAVYHVFCHTLRLPK